LHAPFLYISEASHNLILAGYWNGRPGCKTVCQLLKISIGGPSGFWFNLQWAWKLAGETKTEWASECV